MPRVKTTCDYQLRNVPLDLWQQARAKAKAQQPPMSMRWIIMLLLEQWLRSTTTPAQLLSVGSPPATRDSPFF
jgi:hypothetical protein